MKKYYFSKSLGLRYIYTGLGLALLFLLALLLYGFQPLTAGFLIAGIVFSLIGMSYRGKVHVSIDDKNLSLRQSPLNQEKAFALCSLQATEGSLGIMLKEPVSGNKGVILKGMLSKMDYSEISATLCSKEK